MKSIRYYLIGLLFVSFCSVTNAVELAYKFQTGRTYKYTYERNVSTSSTVDLNTTKDDKKGQPIEFSVKSITFNNGAFVIDTEMSGNTIRRYIKPNGELIGSPSESGKTMPFFLTFPQGNLNVGTPYKTTHSIFLGNKEYISNRFLTLQKYSKKTGDAELTFVSTINLPEVKTGKKILTISGNMTFNILDGFVKKANWISKYSFDYHNKENAIKRNLWNFEFEQQESIVLTKVED